METARTCIGPAAHRSISAGVRPLAVGVVELLNCEVRRHRFSFLWRDPAENRILIVLPLWDCGQRDSAVHQIHSPSLDRHGSTEGAFVLGRTLRPNGGRRIGLPPLRDLTYETLRKWWRRFQSEGDAGLIEKSRRPHRFAAQKVFADQEAIILALRRERRLGVKQLRNELIRQHQIVLSLDTLHRVLLRHNEQVLKRPRRLAQG